MASRFVYRPRDPSTVDKRASQTAGNREGYIKSDHGLYSPKKGDNWIRILPATFDRAENYGMDIWVHFAVGPDDASVLCPASHNTGKCPLCEARVRAERSGDTVLADSLKPKRRVAVWLIDRNEPSKGPLIWAMPWTVDRDIAKICHDRRTGKTYLIEDPEEGYDVSFDREGEKDRTKYVGFQLDRSPSPVDDQWLDHIQEHPIPDTLLWRDYDEINHLYTGGIEDLQPGRSGGGREPPTDGRRDRDPPPPRDRRDSAPPPRDDARDPPPRRGAGRAEAEPEQEPRREREPPPRREREAEPADDRHSRYAESNGADRDPRDEPPPAGRSRAEELRQRYGARQ